MNLRQIVRKKCSTYDYLLSIESYGEKDNVPPIVSPVTGRISVRNREIEGKLI